MWFDAVAYIYKTIGLEIFNDRILILEMSVFLKMDSKMYFFLNFIAWLQFQIFNPWLEVHPTVHRDPHPQTPQTAYKGQRKQKEPPLIQRVSH